MTPLKSFSPLVLLDIKTLLKHSLAMSIVEQLQKKAAGLPESTAAEVLDFLEFVSAKVDRQTATASGLESQPVRGALRGRLSTSRQFAEFKKHEIALEQ